MRFQILFFCTILTFTCFLTGCPGDQPTTNTNSTNGQTNTAANAPKTNSAMETTKATPEALTNEAPTLKPVFKAYCDAMTKKDEAALRKVYSQATLKALEADMKAENEKSLMKYLEIEQVSNELCEIRNEKIDGDVGVAEVKTKGMPTGAKLKFVKENGEWKLTTEIPDFEAVKKAAENSNTAK
ncbi:MAG TPA: hypothetical protein VNB22_16305 [Pyrinomonadaceae bacterium]|jgi:hypothetical protein|nr:hypothetical protein [Pyrinomonadaceae bacterium]